MSKPRSSRKMRMAGMTLRKLASGSPMPMSTMLVMMRSSPTFQPSSLFATQTWPTISAAVRLRLKPCCAVEQNEQSSTQPTCEEMHNVPRSSSGMNTVSKAWPLPPDSSHLRVPSDATCVFTISGSLTSARPASCARKSLARSVIAEMSDSPRLYSQFMSWRARNGLLPSSPTNASSSALSRPSRFTRSTGAAAFMRSPARADLRLAEEVGDFLRGGFRCVRAVHGVGLDALGEVGADGARRGLLPIRGAHDLAVLRDGVLAFEHLQQHRTRGHVLHEVLEERARGMHGVETLGIPLGQVLHAGRDHAQAGLFEAAQDLADEVTGDAVGFDDGEGALERHESIPLWGSIEARDSTQIAVNLLKINAERSFGGGASHRKAFAAPAFALDVRVVEA